MGQAINVVVPTGNFGNILAAYYAKKMGLPIAKLICASNRNRVLTDFIRTGTYDRNREFHATTSPSMDTLISSNLERLLYDLAGRDDAEIRRLMGSLKETGRYTVPAVSYTHLDVYKRQALPQCGGREGGSLRQSTPQQAVLPARSRRQIREGQRAPEIIHENVMQKRDDTSLFCFI